MTWILREAVGRVEGAAEILSEPALHFLEELVREFQPRIEERLLARERAQAARDGGRRLQFLPETEAIRAGAWRVRSIPDELSRRKVEITGPVDRKMIINALNSGADVFMADFEDASSPTWANMVRGQLNVRDANLGGMTFTDPTTGKRYEVRDDPAKLFVRPRGLHMVEAGLSFKGKSPPASLFDFGLYFFHNAKALAAKGRGLNLYIPKLESHTEARVWSDIFKFAEDRFGLARGTVTATVLIETLPAAFEMDEILYELREHIVGLNCGRWDYIFSAIKTHRADRGWLLPDRRDITMAQPMMRAYSQLLIKTCHRRGAFAMGGMAAHIPVKSDAARNDAAMKRVEEDKRREARDGHDGTWVAHPGLVSIARAIFDEEVPGPNQLARDLSDLEVTAEQLLELPRGARTEEGLRQNIRVSIEYLEAWLRGEGCVPINYLMEDAATAEIARSQVWQWLVAKADVGGEPLTDERYRRIFSEEVDALKRERGESPNRLDVAASIFDRLVQGVPLANFLTTVAYEHLEDFKP